MDPLVPSAAVPTSSSSSSLQGGSSSTGSSFPNPHPPTATAETQCPACAQMVPLSLINQHLDQSCQSFKGTPSSDSYSNGTQPSPRSGIGKGKSKQTKPTASYLRQPSLHSFFGGVDPTIPNDFILTRNSAKGGTLEATFSRHGMQTLARVEWSASVYLRGLKKSIVLATDIKLDELADELDQLSIQPLFDGEEEFDDSEFGDDDEDGEDGVAWVEEHSEGHEDAAAEEMEIDHSGPDPSAPSASASSSSSGTTSVAAATQPPAPNGPFVTQAPVPPRPRQQSTYAHSETTIRHVPYLKSHLQKCIRRRLVDQSVSTALALINVNYNEFIRRIPIIAIEDARVFGAAFPVLVWLMLAASKGYSPLPQSLVPDVLGAVAQIAASYVQDKGWMHCPRGQRGDEVNFVLNSIEVTEGLPRWARDILWSIRCRREFGGMAGDIKMLDQSLVCLFHRFATCHDRSVLESHFLAPIPILPAQAIPGPIQRNRFLLNAIDFHVSPIVSQLAARYPQFSPDLLKATIWECSSGVNRRSAATNWDPVKAKSGDPSQGWEWDTPREYAPSAELVHVWRAIEGEFMKMASELLLKRGALA